MAFDPSKPCCPGCKMPLDPRHEVYKLRHRYEKGAKSNPDPSRGYTRKSFLCDFCRAMVTVLIPDDLKPDEPFTVENIGNQN